MSLTTDTLEHLERIINLMQSKEADFDETFLVNNISWPEYEKLLDQLEDTAGIRTKYWEDNLLIMSPSHRHEFDKEIIGTLLETYFLAKKIRFYPFGSTTLKNKNLKQGIEPDKSYCFYQKKDIPDLAIEVIVTSGGLDSLKIYQGLGVKEVWFWEKKQLSIYVLENNSYTQFKQSFLLPNLDLDLLTTYIMYDEPFDAILEFKEKI